MSYLENKIFHGIKKTTHIYVCYVDDILILADNIEEIKKLRQTFQNNSVLKFTYELNVNNGILFLDVQIDANNDKSNTSVYKKTY